MRIDAISTLMTGAAAGAPPAASENFEAVLYRLMLKQSGFATGITGANPMLAPYGDLLIDAMSVELARLQPKEKS